MLVFERNISLIQLVYTTVWTQEVLTIYTNQTINPIAETKRLGGKSLAIPEKTKIA